MPISNCEKCGAVFAQVDSPICPECSRKEEAEFQKAVEWLRDNPGKTIGALSEGTGISSSDILRWTREQRLLFSGNGQNVLCKRCGKPIASGNLCDDCKSTLSDELSGNAKGTGFDKSGSGKAGGMHYSRRRRRR